METVLTATMESRRLKTERRAQQEPRKIHPLSKTKGTMGAAPPFTLGWFKSCLHWADYGQLFSLTSRSIAIIASELTMSKVLAVC